MIDLPENEILENEKPKWLTRVIDVATKNNNQTSLNDFNTKVEKNTATNNANTTGENDQKENSSATNDDDMVNYKVGRLVMSILREFQVANLLDRFEKVLVQNINHPDIPPDVLPSSTKPDIKVTEHTFRKHIPENSEKHIPDKSDKNGNRICRNEHSFNYFLFIIIVYLIRVR